MPVWDCDASSADCPDQGARPAPTRAVALSVDPARALTVNPGGGSEASQGQLQPLLEPLHPTRRFFHGPAGTKLRPCVPDFAPCGRIRPDPAVDHKSARTHTFNCDNGGDPWGRKHPGSMVLLAGTGKSAACLSGGETPGAWSWAGGPPKNLGGRLGVIPPPPPPDSAPPTVCRVAASRAVRTAIHWSRGDPKVRRRLCSDDAETGNPRDEPAE